MVGVEDNHSSLFTLSTDEGTFIFRVRPVTRSGRKGQWGVSDLIAIGELELMQVPSLPGLVRFDYNDREPDPRFRGQYALVGAPNGVWTNVVTRTTGVRVNVVDADGEDQRNYLNRLKVGDLQATIVGENQFVTRLITRTPDYTYEIVDGLPPGLTLRADTYPPRLEGTVETAGTYTVQYRVTDAYGATAVGNARITVR